MIKDLEQDRSDVWRTLGIAQDATADDAIAAIVALRTDSERLNRIEAVLQIGADPMEIFFAGLRSDPALWRPDAYQVELESASKQYQRAWQGLTLRAAIDAAMPAASPLPERDRHA